jgi:hypothetical protein
MRRAVMSESLSARDAGHVDAFEQVDVAVVEHDIEQLGILLQDCGRCGITCRRAKVTGADTTSRPHRLRLALRARPPPAAACSARCAPWW